MSGLALFTAPKPFTDPRIALIQTNALLSWRALGDVELFLLGDEPGTTEAATLAGATVIEGVRKNDQGTPLISSMVELVRENSKSDLLCIINADMILLQDLPDAAATVAGLRNEFVLLGRRWDVTVEAPLEFSVGWEADMRDRVRREGKLHKPAGSDFFVFPRSCYMEIPDFAVGRAGWDNWMVYRARSAGWPVVDCTPSVVAIHQTHDYRHLPGGMTHHATPESDENIRLAGGHGPIRYTILDATHELVRGRLVRPPITRARALRRIEILLRAIFSFLPAPMVEEISRPKRWRRRLQKLLGKRARGGKTQPENPEMTGTR